MKWSSSSNSSLSNGSVVTMPLNNSMNNSSTSSTGSTSSNFGQNCGIMRSAATVRRHESDRRSIFYTDPHDMEVFVKTHNNKKMSPSFSSSRLPTSNGITERNGNATAAVVPNGNSTNNDAVHSRLQANRIPTETDEIQRRKCENLISYFTTQIHHLNKELEIEKRSRDIHLAKIAKALLCFEAKLKSDQKQIRQQLYEKDTQLSRLASEVTLLREKYGVKDAEQIQIDSVAQYCPNCRKQYYFLNTADVGVQVKKHAPNCRDDVDKENNALPTSSSEDGLGQVFSSEVRRSRRYMSKRTSGTFREYLNSRNIDLAFNCSDESFNRSSESSQPQSEHMEHKPLPEQNKTNALMRKGSMIRSTKSSVPIKCDKNGNQLEDKTDSDTRSKGKSSHETNGKESVAEQKNGTHRITATPNNSFLKKYIDDKPKNPQFESTDDWYASASDMDDSDGAVSKPYGYNAVNPVLECVNQILLQQSMDGIMESCTNKNDSATGVPAATSTPSNNNNNNNATESPPKETTNTNTLKKRVHFSTQNSMVQVPRSDSSSNLYGMNASTMSNADTNAKDLSYATIYSNDYEPIGSENNSTNHYVDMYSKLEDERPSLVEKPKTPPALPPKPPNLMKFRQILKVPTFPVQSTSTKSVDNESEPDYCSIGDVQETVKSVQIVADVHKNADDETSSHASEETKTDMTEETFADVPKQPNVVALLSPKKDSAQIKANFQDHATKPNPSLPRAKPAVLPTKAVVANLLSEINAQKAKNPMSNQLSKPKIISDLDESTKKIVQSPLKLISQQKMSTIVESTTTTHQMVSVNPMKALPIIKQNDKLVMPIQAEFDWYNLDVEYGKLLPTNLMENGKEPDSQDRVEYNLDAEFSLTSCSDNNSSLESSGSTIHFVPITVAEDCNNSSGCTNQGTDDEIATNKNGSQLLNPARLKKLINKTAQSDVNVKSFDTFLEQTGLTAKPLPQKRKIFYNAPFV